MSIRNKFHPGLAAATLVLLLAACGPANGGGDAQAGAESASESGENSGDVVARIGAQAITSSDLDAHLAKVNLKAVQQYHDARGQALEGLINQQILDVEAAAQGLTATQLQLEIMSSVPHTTEEEIKNYYDENQNRMGLKSLQNMRGQIEAFLVKQRQQQAMMVFLSESRTKHGVTIHMEPLRFDVRIAENDPFKGSKEAAVTIVEYSDFQ